MRSPEQHANDVIASASKVLPDRGRPFVLAMLRRDWPRFGALFLAVSAAAGCAVAVQYGMKMLVDALGSADRSAAWYSLALFVVLLAAESLLWRSSGWVGSLAIIDAGVNIRLALFRHLAGQPMRYFADQLSGALANRITTVAGNFGGLVSAVAWQILPPCIDFAGALFLFFLVDWRMAAALAAFVAVAGIGMTLIGTRGQPLHRLYAGEASHVAGELVDTITNIWAIKAFTAARRERERLAGMFGTEAVAQRRSWLYLEKMRLAHDAALWLMGGGMLVWAVSKAIAGTISIGDTVMISALTFRILHGTRDLGFSLTALGQQLGIIDEALKTIGQPHAVIDLPRARALHVSGGAIHIREMMFSYPGRSPLFREFNLFVPAGQKLGIVGRSGAGKSTLISLIQRLYDIQDGQICLDGQSVAHVTQESLRAAIAVVPQDIVLFHRTVMENLRIGRPLATDTEVRTAARQAHCDDFIQKLPDGYDTVIGERGVRLSGGQRQRIGIARALLKRAPLVILDEATSSLDSESERAIQDALVTLSSDRTMIAVAHRMSTLAACDRIIVIEEGRIVQDGPPAMLVKIDGPFSALWNLQTTLRQTA